MLYPASQTHKMLSTGYTQINAKFSNLPIGDFSFFITKPCQIRHGRRRPYLDFLKKTLILTGARTRASRVTGHCNNH